MSAATLYCPRCGGRMVAAEIAEEARWVCAECYYDDGPVYSRPNWWLAVIVAVGWVIVCIAAGLLVYAIG